MAAHHRKAAAGFSFKSLEVIIAYEVKDEETKQHAALLQQAIINSRAAQEWDDNTQAIVVSFHFGPKHDSMILFDSKLKQLLPAGMRLLPDNQSDIGSLIVWLQREASLSQPLTSEDIGVVLLAYGADFNWNEQMREAAQLLMNRHQIEFVFSMADQSTIERAIRKLERRGAKAAIIVRSFTMEESFRREIERMVGLDIENKAQNTSAHEAHVAQGFVQHGIIKNIPTRIRTPLPIRTTGGMGAHPLFAPPCLIVRAPYLEMRPKKTSLWWHMAQKMTSKTQNEQ